VCYLLYFDKLNAITLLEIIQTAKLLRDPLMFKVGSFTHLRAVATIDVSIMEYSSLRCYESEFDVFQEMCDRDC